MVCPSLDGVSISFFWRLRVKRTLLLAANGAFDVVREAAEMLIKVKRKSHCTGVVSRPGPGTIAITRQLLVFMH